MRNANLLIAITGFQLKCLHSDNKRKREFRHEFSDKFNELQI